MVGARALGRTRRGSWWSGRHAGVATSTVLALASSALVALAITSTGYASTNIALQDGGVWVTSHRDAYVVMSARQWDSFMKENSAESV